MEGTNKTSNDVDMDVSSGSIEEGMSLPILIDYDACGEFGDSISCGRVMESWRNTLSRQPELIRKIAEMYARSLDKNDGKLHNILRAQAELLIAVWLNYDDKLDEKTREKLDDIINEAYDTLRVYNILLNVPCDVSGLEFVIFYSLQSILHTLHVTLYTMPDEDYE